MKILVTGSTGFVGSKLVPKLKRGGHTVIGYGSKDIDFNEMKLFIFPECDIVIHLAGLVNIIRCEKEPESAFRINGLSCAHLVHNSNMKIIYLSTDQIFDGLLPSYLSGYAEEAFPNPINCYGISKLMGEMFIRQKEKNLIIRCGKIYDDKIEWVDKLVKEGQQVYSYSDQIRSYIHVDELCEKIISYMKKDMRGIKHIPGERMNRYDFIKRYYHDTKPIASSQTEHGRLSPKNVSLRSVRSGKDE